MYIETIKLDCPTDEKKGLFKLPELSLRVQNRLAKSRESLVSFKELCLQREGACKQEQPRS